LLKLIEWLDDMGEVRGSKTKELVGRVVFTIAHDQGPVEIGRAENFQLVGEGISREFSTIAFQK